MPCCQPRGCTYTVYTVCMVRTVCAPLVYTIEALASPARGYDTRCSLWLPCSGKPARQDTRRGLCAEPSSNRPAHTLYRRRGLWLTPACVRHLFWHVDGVRRVLIAANDDGVARAAPPAAGTHGQLEHTGRLCVDRLLQPLHELHAAAHATWRAAQCGVFTARRYRERSREHSKFNRRRGAGRGQTHDSNTVRK